jgi:hypothetical protein
VWGDPGYLTRGKAWEGRKADYVTRVSGMKMTRVIGRGTVAPRDTAGGIKVPAWTVQVPRGSSQLLSGMIKWHSQRCKTQKKRGLQLLKKIQRGRVL